MKGMRSWDLVWSTGRMCKVIVTMEGFVMSAGEGGEGRFRVTTRQLWLRLGILDGATQASFKPEIERIGLVTADTFVALVAVTTEVLA